MPAERVNVFIVHTPFQHLIVNHLLKTLAEFKLADNYLVLDMDPRAVDIVESNWKKVVVLEPPVGSSVIGSGKNCRQALREIDGIISPYPEACLFLSDIDWPLNNALYGYIKKARDRNIQMCNYPDGIGSLLVQMQDRRRKFRNIVKSLIGTLGGSPYYSYNSDIMGIAISDKVYSLMPEVIRNKTEREIVTIPGLKIEKSEMNGNGCIFLGQYFRNMHSVEEERELSLRAAEFTANLGYSDLFYKPHHLAANSVEQELFLERGFQLVSDTRPVEEIFLTRQMYCTVSYISSALVHLKMMFGKEVRCISLLNLTSLDRIFKGTGVIQNMRELFRLSGVEINDE
jgi:hypothetical protein